VDMVHRYHAKVKCLRRRRRGMLLVVVVFGSTFLGVGDGCCWCVDVGSVESEWRIEVLLGSSCIVRH
jgi:hypothetical protein